MSVAQMFWPLSRVDVFGLQYGCCERMRKLGVNGRDREEERNKKKLKRKR